MKTIKKEYRIKAPADKVYKALTDEKQMAAWSGADAIMEIDPPGKFSLWGGSIQGENVKVEPREIVQNWKAEEWQNYSKVNFTLSENGTKTLLKLVHEDVPDDYEDSIDKGWDQYYLGPMKEWLEMQEK